MKIVQLVKQLNNTELGKGGTHDTYVLIPNELDVTDIFCEANKPIEFWDEKYLQTVTVRNTVGREKRLVGLGQYYRLRDLSIGDEIVFEARTIGEETEYRVYTKKRDDIFVVQKAKLGFDVQTQDRMELIQEWMNAGLISMEFLESGKKRNDSPEETDFYDVKINGRSLLGDYVGKEYVIFSLVKGSIQVDKFYGWKKHIFELEV